MFVRYSSRRASTVLFVFIVTINMLVLGYTSSSNAILLGSGSSNSSKSSGVSRVVYRRGLLDIDEIKRIFGECDEDYCKNIEKDFGEDVWDKIFHILSDFSVVSTIASMMFLREKSKSAVLYRTLLSTYLNPELAAVSKKTHVAPSHYHALVITMLHPRYEPVMDYAYKNFIVVDNEEEEKKS